MAREQPTVRQTGAPAGDADAEAAAETDAGIGVPVEEIEQWVESWDTPAELPIPTARKIV
jgi:predicted transcriptional regulator